MKKNKNSFSQNYTEKDLQTFETLEDFKKYNRIEIETHNKQNVDQSVYYSPSDNRKFVKLTNFKKDTNKSLKTLSVDGGATKNNFLLQFQSDISNIEIIRPSNIESTALGAGILAGVKNGFWKTSKEPFKSRKNDMRYTPKIGKSERNKLINGWIESIENINK